MEYENNAYKTVGRQPELGDHLEILQVKCRLISIIYITKEKVGGTLIICLDKNIIKKISVSYNL
jgi:hypothetical protein